MRRRLLKHFGALKRSSMPSSRSTDGPFWSWGDNTYGQLGLGVGVTGATSTPALATLPTGAVAPVTTTTQARSPSTCHRERRMHPLVAW